MDARRIIGRDDGETRPRPILWEADMDFAEENVWRYSEPDGKSPKGNARSACVSGIDGPRRLENSDLQ
jgi:hypothetical protein